MDAHHPRHHNQKLAKEKKPLDTKHGTTTTRTTTSTNYDQGVKESQSLSSSPPPPPPPTNSSKQQVTISSPASPTSASSSPSHEFSFTVSLSTNNNNKNSNNAKTPAPTTNSFALDLSPADDIFFLGHLLPLHLLSHLPVSPRSSTNSLDRFTLPIEELSSSSSSSSSMEHVQKQSKTSSATAATGNNGAVAGKNGEATGRNKPGKSFSLFGLAKWRKGYDFRDGDCDDGGNYDDDINGKEKRPKRSKVRFELSHVLKRYMRMVRPLLFFRGRRESIQLRRQPYSFSGVLSSHHHSRSASTKLRGRRGEFSAPASMRTSPSNSGLLVATTTTSDSTMEELQAAIQAAIAHCKNSTSSATEDKVLKC
ncbi:BRI1 kinase inhibitor 1 [Parasponia andersonii]|uniref:BRI1 kinase inhibitor 1 n=1 Tax=Parasponia andersonii TaxID=3476 RepID=A0A2P5ASY6_PARAD|nr:BRI1 kinase inhibitor 1 [Parasponia andersonii]